MNRKRGFTIIEVMIVIAIMGILVALVSGALRNYNKVAVEEKVETIVKKSNKEAIKTNKSPKEGYIDKVRVSKEVEKPPKISPVPKKIEDNIERDIYGDPIDKKKSSLREPKSRQALKTTLFIFAMVIASIGISVALWTLSMNVKINFFSKFVDLFREKPKK